MPIPKHAKVLHSRRWRAVSLVCYGLATMLCIIWYTGALSAGQEYNDTNRIALSAPVEVGDQSEVVIDVGVHAVTTSPTSSTKVALSKLGLSADESYALGSTDPLAYTASLTDFIHTYFPPKLQKSLLYGLEQYFPRDGLSSPDRENLPVMLDYQNGWQTAKKPMPVTSSWTRHNPGWKWEMLGDTEAEAWVKKTLAGSLMKEVWDALPAVILVRT